MKNLGQFEEFKELAREKRTLYHVNTASFGLKEIRQIYKAEEIDIHYYPIAPKIKAIYMCGDGYCSVAVQKSLPDEPKIFALVHELKHHYCDQEILKSGRIHCGDFNMKDPIEISAEIFAAEFIYPLKEFSKDLGSFKSGTWTKEKIVAVKRACKAKVSYRYILRRLSELELLDFKEFEKVQFQKLEHELFGLPYHLRKLRKRA